MIKVSIIVIIIIIITTTIITISITLAGDDSFQSPTASLLKSDSIHSTPMTMDDLVRVIMMFRVTSLSNYDV